MRRWPLALGLVLLAAPVGAQNFELSWFTVDGGGATFSTGATFSLGGTVGQPDAGGPYSGATFSLSGGFWAGATTGGTGPQADLQVTKTDGQTIAVPGQPIAYTIVVFSAGPDAVTGATVTDNVPAALLGATWTCVGAGGGSCTASGSGNINDTVNLPVAATATYTLTGTVNPAATGSLSNTATVAAPGGVVDPFPGNNSATDIDTLLPEARAELSHGSLYVFDLASAGGVPNVDLYRVRQEPYSSYEIVIDEASGDIGSAGPLLERMAPDGTTVVQASVPVGVGFSRSLRWVNTTAATIDDQGVRVRSGGCTTDCGPEDTYRIRSYETTASIPRFNNSGTQVTVLLLQNPRSEPIAGTIYFWNAAGALIGQQPFSLAPHLLLVLNTAAVAPGVGGALTIAHDGPYDALLGKTVALEPATGFSFDTPLSSRPR